MGLVKTEEIKSIINGLKNKKSAGVDEISPKLIKSIADLIVTPLSHILNCSFVEGQFPSKLKQTIIRPILKSGDKSCCNNYRPISLISTFSKVFEKAVLNRLWSFLETNGIVFEGQHGFVKNRSTTSAMLSLINRVVKDIDSKQFAVGMFFDFTKAFDMVDHELLLCKMSHIGVRGTALGWFSSYLEGRRQSVTIPAVDAKGYLQNCYSSEASVSKGVPQGSVLGPILFLLFINSLPSSVKKANICLFADDTSLTISNPSMEALEQITFVESNSLLQWCEENRLSLNAMKTQLLQFHISKRRFQETHSYLNVLLDETMICPSQTVKFLGLFLDENLKFHQHIEHVIKKVSVGIFMLRMLRQTATPEVLLSAYYGLIYPYLTYAVPVWGCETQRTLFLFRLQKKAIRIVFSLPKHQSCKETFKSFRILTFPSIYILETLSFAKNNMSLVITPVNHCYSLRNTSNLVIPRHSTSFFQKHFHYNAVKLFNNLPFPLQAELDVGKFRKQLKSILLEKAVYSARENW
jgi:hypothetical protein